MCPHTTIHTKVKRTELRRVLGELARAMEPNGVLFVSNPRSMQVLFFFFGLLYFGVVYSVLLIRYCCILFVSGSRSMQGGLPLLELLQLCCSSDAALLQGGLPLYSEFLVWSALFGVLYLVFFIQYEALSY